MMLFCTFTYQKQNHYFTDQSDVKIKLVLSFNDDTNILLDELQDCVQLVLFPLAGPF